MPPVPPKLHESAVSLLNDIEQRYKHLFEIQVPDLRKFTGPLHAQQALAEELREATVSLTQQIEDLDLMVDDQNGERNRRYLRDAVEDLRRQLETLRRDTRTALLTSKKAIDSLSKSNRDELFALPPAIQEKQGSSEEKTTDNLIEKTNSDITDALRRTINLMQSELERSVLTSQMLDDSTMTLRSTSTQHDTLSNLMYTSKQLITALEKADWLDRMLILSGFAFFILVILFILKQRILDRAVRLTFWWTRFIPSFSDDEKLLRKMEEGMGSVVAGVSSSLVAGASSLLATASLSSSLASSVIAETTATTAAETVETLSRILEPEASSSIYSDSSIPLPSDTPVPSDPASAEEVVHVEL